MEGGTAMGEVGMDRTSIARAVASGAVIDDGTTLGLGSIPRWNLLNRYREKQYTYFVAQGLYVKIGTTVSPKARISSLQTASPVKLVPLAVVPSYVITEKDAQDHWASIRCEGEWFKRTPELVGWIDRLSLTIDKANSIRERVERVLCREERPRRLTALVRAEDLLRFERLRSFQEEIRLRNERARAAGCRSCLRTEVKLGMTETLDGWFCQRCRTWIHLSKGDLWEKLERARERVDEAVNKLAEMEMREMRLARMREEDVRALSCQ
jgi:hypothetical protein